LNQELVAPAVKCIEGFGIVDVVHKHAAVCAAVEGYTEGLEAFLSCCVPELHCYEAVVDEDFFGQEVCAYGCFVGGGEFFVDLWKLQLVWSVGSVGYLLATLVFLEA
jgi:hypothetical protein